LQVIEIYNPLSATSVLQSGRFRVFESSRHPPEVVYNSKYKTKIHEKARQRTGFDREQIKIYNMHSLSLKKLVNEIIHFKVWMIGDSIHE